MRMKTVIHSITIFAFPCKDINRYILAIFILYIKPLCYNLSTS